MSSTDSVSQALVPVSIPSDSLGSNLQGPDSPQGNDFLFKFLILVLWQEVSVLKIEQMKYWALLKSKICFMHLLYLHCTDANFFG